MTPKEYEEKYPLITIVAKAINIFGRRVGDVAITIAVTTGFPPPTAAQLYSNNAGAYLDALEAHLESLRY